MTKLSEVMTRDVKLIDPNMTVLDVARIMRSENIGSLPVGENDRLVGMVTDRDIVMRAVAEDRAGGTTAARDVMSEGVCYSFEDDDVQEAGRIMAKHQVRRLPVLDRNKRLVGMVALADLGRSGSGAAQHAVEGVSQPTDEPRRT